MAADYVDGLLEIKRNEFQTSNFEKVCQRYTAREVMMPVRDGVRLHTWIYLPNTGEDKYPVILTRSCYPNEDRLYHFYGEEFALRGYVFIFQYVRGRELSEGNWEPNIHEREDGLDAVNWIISQPWCKKLGYWGLSYLSMAGWAMADLVEGKVAAMYLEHYGTDRYRSAYEHGAFRHDVLTAWSMENAGENPQADYLESCRFMPHIKVDETLWGKKVPSYQEYITNPKREDMLWQAGWWHTLREIPRRTKIPLCLVSGWYDHHHSSAMATWEKLNEEAKKHSRLEIGGWGHFFQDCLEGKKTENLNAGNIKKILQWFQMTLAEERLPAQEVRFYRIGEDGWHTCKCWETGAVSYRTFFPGDPVSTNVGNLRENQWGKESVYSYEYDPHRPVTTISGEGLLHSTDKIGIRRQPQPGWRQDVISFVSEPLKEALSIQGKIRVELEVSTDCEDTAFTAAVMEVSEGKAYNIRSSVATIGENGEYHPGERRTVVIEMWDIAYKLPEGSRIRLDISSSDFPKYNIHSNYSGLWSMQNKTRKASQKVFTGGDCCTKLLLPVIQNHS